MSKETSVSHRESMGRAYVSRRPRSRFTRIEARRELAVTGEPAGLTQLIKANAAAFTFLGITMGVFVSRKFFIVPVGIAAMLLQDFVKGSLDAGPRTRGRRRKAA